MANRYKRRGPRVRSWTPESWAGREKLLGRNPWGGFNHYSLGCEFSRVGYWVAAAAEFERAVEINPWQASFQTNLARAYLSLGDTLKAKQAIDAALLLRPDSVEGMFGAGSVAEKSGHPEEAIRWYRRCLAADLPYRHPPAGGGESGAAHPGPER